MGQKNRSIVTIEFSGWLEASVNIPKSKVERFVKTIVDEKNKINRFSPLSVNYKNNKK